jgi:hypothetical protein
MEVSWVSRCLRAPSGASGGKWLVRWGLGAGRGTTRADHVRPPDSISGATASITDLGLVLLSPATSLAEATTEV